MNVLIIFAHPKSTGSFNHAVLEEFSRGLLESGHNVDVVDLYRIKFDPVFRVEDYAFLADESIPDEVLKRMNWEKTILDESSVGPFGFIKKYFAQRWLRGKSMRDIVRAIGSRLPKDVLEQQEKVLWADGIVFISPIIWMHYPAIMKGWVERVFTYGFAYSLSPEGWKGSSQGRNPLLKLDKALSINTTFFSEEDYKSQDFQGAISKIVDDWGLSYPGIKQVEHVYFYSVMAVSDEQRKKYLQQAYHMGKLF